MAELHIGADRLEQPPKPIHLQSDSLLRHVMALGTSGSGKTVFCKVVTEEALLAGVPAICIDPQGDLCSLLLHIDDEEFLAEKGISPEHARKLKETIDPVIFTPASRKGIAVSADPISGDVSSLKPADRVVAITGIATMIVSLLGYDLEGDDGAGLVAVFDRALAKLDKQGRFPRTLDQFSAWLNGLDDSGKAEFSRYIDVRKLDDANRKLARLDVGARRLMFHEGLSLDIDLLLGRGDRSASVPGKTRLSVVYLNTLHSQEDKEFFIAALTERLYSWMLRNPSKSPQALFYIDEVAPFIPPVRKPACKPALSLLFKQARKYGVCCLMATQNPADVDYKAMSQFGTWALGRMTTRQDIAKVQPTVKSLDPTNVDAIMQELPSLKAGQFVLISPDNFRGSRRLQTRWLLTKHETLDDERIQELTDELYRERFNELEGKLAKAAPEPEVVTQAQGPVVAPQKPVPKPEQKPEQRPAQPSQAPKSKPSARDTELEQADTALAKAPSMTAKEFAAKTGVSDSAARTRLRKLVDAGLAREFKEGRAARFFSVATGLRPDIGLTKPLDALLVKVSRNDAERTGRDKRGRAFLGLIGQDEELDRIELEYRLVIQLAFREQVTRALIKRMFGRRHDEMQDNIYLHPFSLKVVTYDPKDGVRLDERPGDYASRIIDFDGLATFAPVKPAEVPLRESDFKTRKPDDAVRESFKTRFRATPKSIRNVLMPVWNLHMLGSNRGGTRVVTIDGMTGSLLQGW
jgi:DNA-binding transcriptional ArsR family regulator